MNIAIALATVAVAVTMAIILAVILIMPAAVIAGGGGGRCTSVSLFAEQDAALTGRGFLDFMKVFLVFRNREICG
ncbi:MAG: hypothetical protein FWF69_01860 [Firmicutes bacterium]|nr:hypothetical protein [Bacillota bacterium]